MSDLALREPLTDQEDTTKTVRSSGAPFRWHIGRCLSGKRVKLALQILHFCISMFFLWAGIVEFVNHPPYFDAYGDAFSSNNLLPKSLKNDPRTRESELLRLMDLPIILLLVMYQLVCIWLKYRGRSWMMTFSFVLAFVTFWVVNFARLPQFDWSYYSKRMNGLYLQVSTIALSGTTVFMVIFCTRKKLPFKFKSSLRIRQNSKFHILWNFLAIYLVMFMAMTVWFIKMYASWALFSTRTEILQLCSTTTEVECYPCHSLNKSSLHFCVHYERHKMFTCSMIFQNESEQGSFCIFNFNMSIYEFLMTFAYIGGISVFMSTFLRVAGHYTVRGMVYVYDTVRRLHCGSSSTIDRQREVLRRRKTDKHRPGSRDNNANDGLGTEESYSSDSEDDRNDFINSLIVELP